MKYDIFFYETFKEEEELLKKHLPKDVSAGFSYTTIQETKNKNCPAKIISPRTQSIIPIEWHDQISVIISRSTGFDHLQELAKKIPCGYLPNYCKDAVAEQAILLCLSLLRRLPEQIRNFRNFNRNNLTGTSLKGKNLSVVGVGKIGHEIYTTADKLGSKVFGVDIVKRHKDVNYVTIERALEISDIIICSMNLTKENHNYFNYDLLRKSKPGLIFINIARGELSPSIDLLKLVNEKHLGGIALDVFNNESLLAENLRSNSKKENEEIKATKELMNKESVILTPHNAFNTTQSLEKRASQTIEQLNHFLNKKELLWRVP